MTTAVRRALNRACALARSRPPRAQVLKPTFVSRDAHIQKRRKDKLADEREKRQNWERVKKEIEANVRKRPHLFEQASTSVHVDRARQERLEQFEQTLRDNGLGELIDG